jgi:uncharacterized protein
VSAAPPLWQAAAERWQHPSPRLGVLRRGEVAATAAVLLLAAGLPLLLTGLTTVAAAVAGGLVVAAGIADLLLQRRVRSWAFSERAEDLLVRRGLMVQRLSLVPYGRMQFVDVSSGPLERAMGLATVRLHTAAASSDARIPGLPRADAERLRDQLSTLGGAQMAGL